ncbi:hypothetical protein GCM10010170_098640 [Dactylosporangium salmoneum]|uniref:Uncharacterized protein n=2 Tax=Dactylosporangium salmoneum TaxID=53361 RepID=A0ABP5UXY0_9ACTN
MTSTSMPSMPFEDGISAHLALVLMACVAIAGVAWHWPTTTEPIAVGMGCFHVLYQVIRRR